MPHVERRKAAMANVYDAAKDPRFIKWRIFQRFDLIIRMYTI